MRNGFPVPNAELVLAPGNDHTGAWHSARRMGIGASEVAACVDQHPYMTAVDVWRDKLGQLPPVVPTDDMLAGIALEPMVASVFAGSVGVDVVKPGMWRHPDDPIALANPDRLVSDGAGLEIKTHGVHSCRAWEQPEVPFYVEAQAQWCMYVTGIRSWWVASWCKPESRIRTWRLSYDPDIVEYLRYGADALWFCVENRRPPSGASLADLDALYPAPTPGAEIRDDRLGALRATYDRLRVDHDAAAAVAADFKSEMDDVKAQIKQIMGTAETGRDADGRVVVTWKTTERSDIDVDALRRKDPDIAARHARVTPGRRLAFPKPRKDTTP